MHAIATRVSAIVWVAMAIYWIVASPRAARGTAAESRRSRLVHLSLFWISVLLALLPGVPPLDRRWLPASSLFDSAGLAVQACGVLLYFWGRAHMGRFWSGIISSLPDHRIVRSGPYRALRHPMYAGILAMFLGTAILVGEWHALLVFGIILLAYWRKIRKEERHLRRVFGAEYDEFARQTWAFIPGVL